MDVDVFLVWKVTPGDMGAKMEGLDYFVYGRNRAVFLYWEDPSSMPSLVEVAVSMFNENGPAISNY